MNRYSFGVLKPKRTKAFFLKPGYRWTLNSLGHLENSRRSIHYPMSIELSDVNDDSITFDDSSGGGGMKISKFMEIYDAADHR